MVGQDPRAKQESISQVLFKILFKKEIEQIQEFSFDSDFTQEGRCILGHGDFFLLRVLQFATTLNYFSQWKKKFLDLLENASADDYGLKVDWKNGIPNRFTLYCRYSTLNRKNWTNKIEKKLAASVWKKKLPSQFAKIFKARDPFCLAIRITKHSQPVFSSYINIHLSYNDFKRSLTNFLIFYQWPERLFKEIMKDLVEIMPFNFKGCIGIESNGKILKIDIAGPSIGSISKFLSKKKTTPEKIQFLVNQARLHNQIQFNYFALKYSADHFISWKAYLAIHGLRSPILPRADGQEQTRKKN